MATIHTLLKDGVLVNITVPLGRNEFQNRYIYGLPSFIEWMNRDLPNLEAGRLRSTETPAEQLDNIFYRWVTGKEIRYDKMFKDLMPRGDEVWELKTADLRVFGWMVEKSKFIAVLGDYADFYKSRNPRASYESAKAKVISARDNIKLNEPKFITGVYPDDIL
jgi:hypothetical protein